MYQCKEPGLCRGLEDLSHCFSSPDAFRSCSAADDDDDASAGAGAARRALAARPGRALVDAMCVDGSVGPYCGVCERKHYESFSGEGCASCEDKTFWPLVGVAAAVAAVAAGVALASTFSSRLDLAQLFDAGKFKIVWATVQVCTATTWALETEWPDPFGPFLKVCDSLLPILLLLIL